MALKKCNFCGNQVPQSGQCNKCGFIDGFTRPPTDDEFKAAREINKKANYEQFKNIDMLLLD
jgi:predicted ATP-dependent serine protease